MSSPNPSASSSPKRFEWIYSVLPISMATGPMGTVVQLFIIEQNGIVLGTIYAGLAVAIFNGIGIPAAIFWGFTTDRLRKRRALVIVSYTATAGTMLLFFLYQTTPGAILAYAILSFVTAASATPLNLLIMESEPKASWLVVGTLWSLPIIFLSVPFALLSLGSAVMALVSIREPMVVFERETIVRRKSSFLSRLLEVPVMFLTIPKPADFRRVFRGLRYGITSATPLLYVSIIFFYLASGLFNTSFVPALSSFSVSEEEIFAVSLAGMLVQTVAFQYAGRYVGKRPLPVASFQGLVLRGGAYVALGALALLVTSPAYFLAAIFLYPIASGIAFALYYTASNTMVFNTVQSRSPGSALGVYSAVVGMATLAGSLASGFVSVYFGFDETFAAAGILLFLSAIVVLGLRRFERPPEIRAVGQATTS
jgi:predicted MFS family arabinose efflux permease